MRWLLLLLHIPLFWSEGRKFCVSLPPCLCSTSTACYYYNASNNNSVSTMPLLPLLTAATDIILISGSLPVTYGAQPLLNVSSIVSWSSELQEKSSGNRKQNSVRTNKTINYRYNLSNEKIREKNKKKRKEVTENNIKKIVKKTSERNVKSYSHYATHRCHKVKCTTFDRKHV